MYTCIGFVLEINLFEFVLILELSCFSIDLCKEMVDGLRTAFDFCLPTILLYDSERAQFEAETQSASCRNTLRHNVRLVYLLCPTFINNNNNIVRLKHRERTNWSGAPDVSLLHMLSLMDTVQQRCSNEIVKANIKTISSDTRQLIARPLNNIIIIFDMVVRQKWNFKHEK